MLYPKMVSCHSSGWKSYQVEVHMLPLMLWVLWTEDFTQKWKQSLVKVLSNIRANYG